MKFIQRSFRRSKNLTKVAPLPSRQKRSTEQTIRVTGCYLKEKRRGPSHVTKSLREKGRLSGSKDNLSISVAKTSAKFTEGKIL